MRPMTNAKPVKNPDAGREGVVIELGGKGLMGEVAALFLPLFWMLAFAGVLTGAPSAATIRATREGYFHSHIKRLLSPSFARTDKFDQSSVGRPKQTSSDRTISKDAPRQSSSRGCQGGPCSHFEVPPTAVAYLNISNNFNGPRSTYLELNHVRSPPNV